MSLDINHGETAQSARADKLSERTPLAVKVMTKLCAGIPYAGVKIEAIKFKFVGVPHAESLCIITGFDEEEGPVVAFHTAVTAEELLVGVMTRVRNGTLKWKEDAYRT